MQFQVHHRFTGEVQFTAEIECDENTSLSIKLGLAVRCAIKARANLAYAYLAGADLARANLADAYLAHANLADADLAGANLADAYLADADLLDANLAGANLAGANLADAYLAHANLGHANLAGANLAGANLGRANLAGANLAHVKTVAAIGFPDGWAAWTYLTENAEQRVRVGCRDMTLVDGRAYWANKSDRREVLAALDYAEVIARIREWDAAPAQEAAE